MPDVILSTFPLHGNPRSYILLLFLFSSWESWGMRQLNNLLKSIILESGRVFNCVLYMWIISGKTETNILSVHMTVMFNPVFQAFLYVFQKSLQNFSNMVLHLFCFCFFFFTRFHIGYYQCNPLLKNIFSSWLSMVNIHFFACWSYIYQLFSYWS